MPYQPVPREPALTYTPLGRVQRLRLLRLALDDVLYPAHAQLRRGLPPADQPPLRVRPLGRPLLDATQAWTRARPLHRLPLPRSGL